MRKILTKDRVQELMGALGAAIPGEGRIYFTGGVSALWFGWRASTIDADLSADPEPAGFFAALPRVKEQLQANLELAAPADFQPVLPGWRERSLFIAHHGRLDFYHYDLYSQALAKIQRGYERDLIDLRGMVEAGLVDRARLAELFQAIEAQLVRFPKIEPARLAERVAKFASAA